MFDDIIVGIESDDEQLRKYCPKCNKITDWEDGFNIETGEYTKWLLCVSCEEEDR